MMRLLAREVKRSPPEFFRVKIGDGRSEWDVAFGHGFWRTLRAASGPVAAGRQKRSFLNDREPGLYRPAAPRT